MTTTQKTINFQPSHETREQRLRRILSGRIELSGKDHGFTGDACAEATARVRAANNASNCPIAKHAQIAQDAR